MYQVNFIAAINAKRKIRLSFFSKQDGTILIRMCAPMDFGPSRRAKNKDDRYHFWDYESDTTNHVLSLLPDQIHHMEFVDDEFDPAEFITWPCNWFALRDWGIHS
ncbi:hypothetical protein QFZ20_001413 [Flavobacterium sp. W4I14]|nr:hypothetical protein [Flavobacterium sp. W4I14]